MTHDRDKLMALAEGLTEAQRAWLIAAEPTLEQVSKSPCAEWWDNPERLYVDLDGKDHWLGSRSMESPEGSSSFTAGWERLTPLGLAVRDILKAGQD